MKRIFFFLSKLFGLLVVFIFLSNLLIFISTKRHIYNVPSEAPEADVALIPGAAVSHNGALSPVFLDRIDMAITLYENKQVSKILVSGDNSTESYNEVNPVRLYLIEKGVLDQDIFLDHAGFDTYSTMYRARDIFEVSSVLISSQSFHLPRSVFIARRLGLEASGVKSDVGHTLLRNYVREVFANEKVMIDLLTNREPEYLGDTISITGDGRNSL